MALSDNALILDEKMDLVTFIIKVDDEEISKNYHITSINVHNEINVIPRAVISIVDGDTDKEDFEISSSGEFAAGKKIEIQLGYENNNEIVFNGIIVSNTHKINNNCSELNIECKHETFKMTLSQNNNHFNTNITSTEIVEKLINDYDIKINIDPSKIKHPQVLQSNISDWDFMVGHLDADGMICLFNNDGLKITKLIPTGSSTLDLTFGRNILEFNGDRDTRTQTESVKIYSWDFKNQEVAAQENEKTGVNEDETENTSKTFEIRSSASYTEDEITSISTAKKTRQDLSKVKAKVKYIGNLSVSPGGFINIAGVGKKFDGTFFVSAIDHEYTDGCWITEAALGWDDKFFSEQTNPGHSASAAAQPSTLHGLQIGIVTGIEDEEGQYRVRIKLPVVDDKAEGLLARVATLDAGKNRGTFFRPEVDDEVLIGFLNDDPSSPVILGMLHSGPKPAPIEPEKNNNKKGYVSRSGIKMTFDDGEKKLTIETPGERVFELDDDSATITLKDSNGNKIIMDQTGISIEAEKSIKLKAGTELTIESSQISVNADGILKLEGSGSTNLNSSGITEIKGSLVKIN